MQHDIEFVEAPTDWAYHLFPLPSENVEELALDWVVAIAEKLIKRAQYHSDEAYLGPVLHWAHLLKIAQSSDGSWPAHVNPRTGIPIGTTRTHTPSRLMAKLGEILDSSEFEDAVALAHQQ
ncbi:MAG: hypothetical protein JO316_04395 [Abitibacteriaceae bacterium]|nr:hypothetical protein [Abditibacteriaceae bacterium]